MSDEAFNLILFAALAIFFWVRMGQVNRDRDAQWLRVIAEIAKANRFDPDLIFTDWLADLREQERQERFLWRRWAVRRQVRSTLRMRHRVLGL